MEDDALTWLIGNSKTTSTSTQRHMELALCHLAQNGNNPRLDLSIFYWEFYMFQINQTTNSDCITFLKFLKVLKNNSTSKHKQQENRDG